MKKFFLFALIIFCLSLKGNFTSHIENVKNTVSIQCCDDDIWVEYICTDGQWYKITHYPDGSIKTEPIYAPPQE